MNEENEENEICHSFELNEEFEQFCDLKQSPEQEDCPKQSTENDTENLNKKRLREKEEENNNSQIENKNILIYSDDDSDEKDIKDDSSSSNEENEIYANVSTERIQKDNEKEENDEKFEDFNFEAFCNDNNYQKNGL